MTAASMQPGTARILLAAGGTGGHLFPAEALAHELLGRGLAVDLVTDERGQGFGAKLPQVGLHHIAAGGVAGKGAAARLQNVLRLGIGYLQSRRLVKRLRPAVAVGFGGYPSVPPLLAAQHAGVRTVLHEQNAVAGRANRFLLKRASSVATSFERVKFLEQVSAAHRIVTGNPVRPDIAAIAAEPYIAPTGEGPFRLLVVGGSLGARVFGELVPPAIALLPQDLRRRLQLTQQCRAEDLERVAAQYRDMGLAVELQPFFRDIPARLAQTHLLISRAGASTVAELAAAGRPALMIPLPGAIDDHQMANASALADAGGGWAVAQRDLDPSGLAARLEDFMTHPAKLAAAADAARRLGRRDAARALADLVTGLLPAGTVQELEQH
ncbi:undecaprenyldiphospho-muramoylpentapeptide beta-N-acetylglucosaminyltransferase [Dongia soli]|uniref:UDP-N-acetylglucosamine--N-acetylmuramyl-(pentapeptide) pyrophosphoryl-undecaprenol N-acetylglucosamine transferase n=1 Tax=Dongia soli TaxID=600628 RepID=A0ABU5E4V6_9PROT|nr:undecaprenyldiphospho-muramoylpentapeptide beta-N-acetylglucosaminyltransferase [Dongia soli]MDY0881281.1 undecaprenyldiphospho-muramoylpentapeptide beta-N-acetylglucosaminyltransferase [Dongia soli]